jgi:excisionase family DNA binding protein
MIMAGMFCSLEEAAEILNKTPDQIKELVTQGRLREFRDGTSLLLKLDELQALASEEGIEPAMEAFPAETPPPPPLATTQTRRQAQASDLDALEPQDAEMEMPELELPETETAEDESPDLDIDDFGAFEQEDETPAAKDVEPALAIEEPTADDIPAMQEAAADKPEVAPAIPPTKQKPPRKAKPRKVVRTSSKPGLSLGQWFIAGLQKDNPIAVFMLILLLAVIIAACVAIGYAAYYALFRLL